MKEDLTSKEFWDEVWVQGQLGRYLGIEKYLAINKKLDKLFKKYLKKGEGKILEIGCAKAKQLIYFAKEFGYQIYGIDYSKKGIELAEENLRLSGVKGTLLHEDIFQTSLEKQSFDVVYSMGLIEHFKDPAKIIEAHIKLLKLHGILIITIPNLNHIVYLVLSKFISKEQKLYNTHNMGIMNKEILYDLLNQNKITILTLNYFGPLDFTASFSCTKNRAIIFIMHLVNQIVGYATFFMPGSKHLSPYIVIIGQKQQR